MYNGDGIVFVITTDEELNGLSGGAIGYKGIANSLGIELDSFYNRGNGTGYYDPTYDSQYENYRKDHVAVVLNGENTTADKHIATSFLYENGYSEGFTQEGSLTTYGEECDTRLFTVWVEYDGEDLYVSYAKGDFINAIRPAEAQIVVDGSTDSRVKDQLDKFAGEEVKVGFTSAIGSSKANHTIHSVALVNEYIESGIQTTYMEKYYVENPDASDDKEEATDDSLEEDSEVSDEDTTEDTTEDTNEDTTEDTNKDTTDESLEEEEEEDIDMEVPEAAPGVDADAKTGDNSNLTILFVIMIASALGLLVSSKKKASLSK